MAHTSNAPWSTELKARALDLKVNYGLDYENIRQILGFETKDQPRIMVGRLLRKNPGDDGFVAVPEPGTFLYPSWSLQYCEDLPIEGEQEDDVEENEVEDEMPYDVTQLVQNDYELVDGKYLFPVNGKLVAVPEDRWESILRDYSAEGGNLTQHALAMKHGFPKKVLEACLRLYGHFKARPPVSREALKDAEGEAVTPLIHQAIEAKEHRFHTKLREETYRKALRDADELRREIAQRGQVKDEVRTLVRELLEDVAGSFVAPARTVPTKRQGKGFAVHAPLFDLHAGLAQFKALGWSQRDFNSDIALRMVHQHGKSVAQRIVERPGYCKTAYLMQGGDTFHAPFGRTAHGRPLQRDMPDRMLLRALVEAFIAQVEEVRQVAERTVIGGVEGNHGHLLDVLILDFLALYYRDAADVEVNDDFNQRTYFREDESLHVLDHGTTFGNVTSTATMAFAERISRVVAGEDFHGAKRIYFYVGHLHHRENATNSQEKSQAHLNILRVPTICSANDYETMLGFYNDAMADVYFLDEKGRISATDRLYMMDELALS